MGTLVQDYLKQNPYQAPVKAAPKRSSWLSLVPSALAAGASFIPGVGTGAAAALGGLGEAGSELLSGQKLSLKNIGEQAALSAIPGGLGKIGKVRQVLKGGSELEKAVTGAEDVAKTTSKAKQIPVKYVSSTASGTGVRQSANNLLINPTVGATEDAASALGKKGYKVSGKVGNYSSATTPGNTTVPTVNLQGTKTGVKLTDTGKPTTEVLPGTGRGVSQASEAPIGATPVPEKIVTPEPASLTARTGSKIRSANRGIQVGTLVPGEGEKVGLTAEKAKEINGAVDRANKGLRSRTVRGQVQGVQKAKATQQGLIDTEVGKANRELTGTELGGIKDATKPVIDKIPEASTKGENYVSEYDRLLNESKDTKGLNDFIKNMDKEINYGRNAASPDPLKERIAQAYRDAADKKLTELAPNAKAAKAEWANLHTAEKILTQNKNLEGQGVDVFKIGSTLSGGRGIGGGAFQALKEGTGKALEGAGSSKALPTYGRGLLKQVGTRAVLQPGLDASDNPPQAVAEAAPADTGMPSNSLPEPQTSSGPSQDQTEQIKQGLQVALVKALSDGDSKGIANIVSVIGALDKLAPSSTSSGVGKISAQQQSLAKSGKQSLEQLSTLLESDPSLASKNNTPGQGLPIIGNTISNMAGASDYHSLADNILSSLIHLQTGATATKEEIISAHGQLPGPSDPPEVRQRKLETLLSNFEPFLGEQ